MMSEGGEAPPPPEREQRARRGRLRFRYGNRPEDDSPHLIPYSSAGPIGPAAWIAAFVFLGALFALGKLLG